MKDLFCKELGVSTIDIREEKSIENITGYKIEIELILFNIKDQLISYKRTKEINADHSDWFYKASSLKSRLGIFHQLITYRLAELNKEVKKLRNEKNVNEKKDFGVEFVYSARKILDEDLFNAIKDEVDFKLGV
jgi:hypothetical protein